VNGFVPHAEYHADIDILYMQLRDADVARSSELDLWRNIDLSAAGELIGVEFVNASQGVNLRDVPNGLEVAELVRSFGLPILV
jgi:uncharacterized protein YuzE